MLKLQVTSLDEVPQAMREHYVQGEGGAFELQIDGAGSLHSALKMERVHRKNAESRARELEAQVRDLRGLPKRKPEGEMTPRERILSSAQPRYDRIYADFKPRLDALPYASEAYNTELERLRAAHNAEVAKIEGEIDAAIAADVEDSRKRDEAQLKRDDAAIVRELSSTEARKICSAIAADGCAQLLLPHVVDRISVERDGSEWKVIVKDANGKPTTVDGLREELGGSQDFGRVIRGVSTADKAEHARRVAETLGRNHAHESGGPTPLTRRAFDQLSTASQAHHVRTGGQVVDDETVH